MSEPEDLAEIQHEYLSVPQPKLSDQPTLYRDATVDEIEQGYLEPTYVVPVEPNYEAAYGRTARLVGYLKEGYKHPPMHLIEKWAHEIVDAAYGAVLSRRNT